MSSLIVCSHGTSDAQGRDAVRSLVTDVRRRLVGLPVAHAVVDVEQPQIGEVLAASATKVTVVPLLLSAGFHTAVDIARAVAAHGNARQTPPLGTHPLIVEVLVDRLGEALPEGWLPGDHVVLAAAGSSNPRAMTDVAVVAERLRARVPVPVSVGYASASAPRISDAIAAARAAGSERIIVASHVLAPGFFAELIAHAGGDVVTAPLAPDTRLAQIVVQRYRDGVLSR